MDDILFFYYEVAAYHSLIVYWQPLYTLLWLSSWGGRLNFINQNILRRRNWCRACGHKLPLF